MKSTTLTQCGCQTLQRDNVVRDHTSRLFLMQFCLYSRGRKLPAAGHFWPTKSPELGPKLNVINDSILLLGIFFLNLFSIVFFVLCSLYLFLGTAKKKNPKFFFYCRTRGVKHTAGGPRVQYGPVDKCWKWKNALHASDVFTRYNFYFQIYLYLFEWKQKTCMNLRLFTGNYVMVLLVRPIFTSNYVVCGLWTKISWTPML